MKQKIKELKKVLEGGGYKVAEGHKSVKDAIAYCANENTKKLCSGFKVFPSGEKCSGCSDCEADNEQVEE